MKVIFPTIETKFHKALKLDNEFHKLLSDYLERTGRDFVKIREGLYISCDFYTTDNILYKIFIVKINGNKPDIIKMGNVMLFSSTGFTMLPQQAFDTLFKIDDLIKVE